MSEVRQSIGSQDRKLRYRAILEDLTALDLENSNNDETIAKTSSAVKKVQALLTDGGVEERVQNPGESYLDSRVLHATSALAVRCSETVSGNANAYDRHALAAHVKLNPAYWELSPPLRAPPAAALHGAFAAAAAAPRAARAARAARARAARTALADLVAPEDVDRLEKTEEGSEATSRVRRAILRHHRARGPLSYFHLVLGATFSQTVENVYHVAFLVRDAMLRIYVDEATGLPFVEPVADGAPSPCAAPAAPAEENQFIVSIDMHRYRELMRAFDIKEPMISAKKTHAST